MPATMLDRRGSLSALKHQVRMVTSVSQVVMQADRRHLRCLAFPMTRVQNLPERVMMRLQHIIPRDRMLRFI